MHVIYIVYFWTSCRALVKSFLQNFREPDKLSCFFISLLRMPFACSSSQRRARSFSSSYHQHSHDDRLAVPPATRSNGVIDLTRFVVSC